jgi:aryl-alcohol dehydrogenase-like predicted oxidoreductase
VIPIPGASRPESIVDSAAATHVQLSDDHLARLNTSLSS